MTIENVLDKYEYSKKDLIGHGAFAVVFKGKSDQDEKKPVAIKVIQRSRIGKQDKLLGKEVEILKKLKHDNIVCLLDYEETKETICLVMEYCNAGDLAEYLQKQGTLSEDTIRYFLQQIVSAMKALDEKGIIHRDLKPQNILLNREEQNRLRVKIADFGFARHLGVADMAATLCGSPMYMAPEVLMSHVYDSSADLYSIGTIVYQCLTGRAPFHATSPQELRQFYERTDVLKPTIPAGTSPGLSELICSLLKKNPKERMSAKDFFRHPFIRERPNRKKYSSSSPTIPDAKIRTESRTSSPIDSRTSSMTSLTPDEECLVSAGDEEEFVLIPSPMTRQRSKTVSDFGHSRDERFSGRSSLPPRRSHRHSPVSPGIMDSPTGSPTHDQSHQLIQRACTQPDLASYGLRIQTRQSVPSDLKYRSDPRQSPRSSLPYDRQYDSSSSPQRQLVPRVSAPARGHFSIGTPPDHSPSALVPLPEEDDANNNEVSLLEQLQFSYELGLAINLVASEYSANSFRRRGERALLYYKGLQVFVSALHKARNSDPASLTEDKALFKSILLKLHQKFKECRKLCNEQNETREQAEKQKNQKLYSADSILYNFAMKTCEETACADTSGELEQKELKEKYLIARTLLKGLTQTFDCPEDKKKLLLYQNQISHRLAELNDA